MRNGYIFWQTVFWEQQVGRFRSAALQHAQPVWFYLPVLAAALFPWTPVAALFLRRNAHADERRTLLLLWLVFGLIFFSAFLNKLPGYILPLLPPPAALMGLEPAETRAAQVMPATPAALSLTSRV